jgi:excisionase family DNA binding protein
MGERVMLTGELSDQAIERIAVRAAEIAVARLADAAAPSPYLSVTEAAELLRCKRQRVDDLLCQRRLTRVKEGRRTLILRAEVEAYLRGEPTGAWTTPPRRRAA